MRTTCNIFLLLCLFACTQGSKNKEKDIKTYTVAWENISSPEVFFADIDTAYFIPLETNDSSQIGEISQLNISDKLVLSDRKTQSILQFSLDGHFLSAHEAIGNGPGEYVRIDGMYIDKNKDHILVLDAIQNKVLTYDANFKFIEEKHTPVPFGAMAFSMIEDSTFVYEEGIGTVKSDLKYCLFVQPPNGETRHFLPFEKTMSIHFSPRQSLFHVDDALVFVPTYNDTIYNVFEDRVEPRMRIDFGEQWVDEAFVYNQALGKDPMLFMQKLADQNFIYFFNLMENRTHIYMDFYCKGGAYASVIDKKDNSNTLVKFSDPDAQMKPLASHGDYFVFPLAQSEFARIADSNNYTFAGKASMVEINNKLNEESNPVLMFVKFK